ncbi:MAG: hypothetical protein KatS3mg002_1589 [Candidatus Woesearchaeota archaeon]|nr:MAG: hypothetical protein KatS3mg002_1589 [Candidatus Woesearchaeota archaeon]
MMKIIIFLFKFTKKNNKMINNINDIIGMLNSEDVSTLIRIKEILTDIEGSEVILFTKNSNYQIKLIDDEQITLSLLLNSIRLSARQVKVFDESWEDVRFG